MLQSAWKSTGQISILFLDIIETNYAYSGKIHLVMTKLDMFYKAFRIHSGKINVKGYITKPNHNYQHASVELSNIMRLATSCLCPQKPQLR